MTERQISLSAGARLPAAGRGPGERRGLTYLLVRGCNGNEVHVVQTHHVNDPHLLAVGRMDLVKLPEGDRGDLVWGGSPRRAQEHRVPTNPLLAPEAPKPGTDLVRSPAFPPTTVVGLR